jgi:hypothetical protein
VSLLLSHVVSSPDRLTYVKSPVASLCLVCSSVKKRVSVMMSVLTASPLFSPLPLDAILLGSECYVCFSVVALCKATVW